MVTIHQFKNLRQEHQIDCLKEFGAFLDLYRKQEENIVALYALESFYVELHIAKRSDRILEIRSFSNVKKLSPYLEQVNINAVTTLLAY
jgi:hypothetical protein